MTKRAPLSRPSWRGFGFVLVTEASTFAKPPSNSLPFPATSSSFCSHPPPFLPHSELLSNTTNERRNNVSRRRHDTLRHRLRPWHPRPRSGLRVRAVRPPATTSTTSSLIHPVHDASRTNERAALAFFHACSSNTGGVECEWPREQVEDTDNGLGTGALSAATSRPHALLPADCEYICTTSNREHVTDLCFKLRFRRVREPSRCGGRLLRDAQQAHGP